MKIRSITTYPLAIPVKRVIKMARQTVRQTETLIVKIVSDEGITGFGEIAAALHMSGETLMSTKYIIDRYLTPVLIGQDPFNIEKIHLLFNRLMAHNTGVRAAIDIALYDLMGRALKVPVYRLIGGRVRDDIRVTWHLANSDYDLDLEEAQRGLDQGFEVMKFKVGTANRSQELKTLEGLRKRFESLDLRLDANQSLQITEAVSFIKKTEPYGITFFEQPLNYRQLAGMARVCASVDVPIAADEGIFTADDVVANYEAKSADIISLKLMKAGGITGVLRAAQVCRVLGFPIHLAAKIAETSVSTAAAAHVGVALPTLEYDGGTTNHYLQEDIVFEPLLPVGGRLRPTEKPGLGVDVDEAKLTRFLTNI